MMYMEGPKQIEVEMPPLAENSTPVTVQSLHPEDADLTMVRQVHLRGRVNWSSPHLFTLQDETGTIFVSTLGLYRYTSAIRSTPSAFSRMAASDWSYRIPPCEWPPTIRLT